VKLGITHVAADHMKADLQGRPIVVSIRNSLLIRMRAALMISLTRYRGQLIPRIARYHLKEVMKTRPAKYVAKPPPGPKMIRATVASNVGIIRKPR